MTGGGAGAIVVVAVLPGTVAGACVPKGKAVERKQAVTVSSTFYFKKGNIPVEEATGVETVEETAGGRPLPEGVPPGPVTEVRPFLPFTPLEGVSMAYSSLGMSATLVRNTFSNV